MPLLTDPIDLKIDSLTGELSLDGDDLTFSTGVDAVAQGLKQRILLFKGEWFANLDEGVPYYDNEETGEVGILGSKFNEERIRAAIRSVILATPGVSSIRSLSAQYDGATRTVTIAWNVVTTFGDTVTDSGDFEV